ncbi:MAG TPA: uracil-DNA glycosylase [Dongiaceae bacterium]|jgi:uracil-DNA glycosylase family 4|nr:uracil-DNA glycosylase [Dongiaceae bacterium]
MILPDRDCPLCPRLVEFRHAARKKFPDWHNAPVPPFGPDEARLLIVGLAPGLQGANRTGRPFTGDFAGNLLYATLKEFGLARGNYEQRPDDTLQLVNCRISNAVKCVPPENKPTPEEIRICNRFLSDELASLPKLTAVLALGSIAHDAVLVGMSQRKSLAKFAHGARHDLPRGLSLFDSYHCSRYNTNTGRLTTDMFRDVVGKAAAAIA